MNLFSRAYRSSLGRKYIMAITGLLLFLFVIVHMAGNLQAFLPVGPDGIHPLDIYGQKLRALGYVR